MHQIFWTRDGQLRAILRFLASMHYQTYKQPLWTDINLFNTGSQCSHAYEIWSAATESKVSQESSVLQFHLSATSSPFSFPPSQPPPNLHNDTYIGQKKIQHVAFATLLVLESWAPSSNWVSASPAACLNAFAFGVFLWQTPKQTSRETVVLQDEGLAQLNISFLSNKQSDGSALKCQTGRWLRHVRLFATLFAILSGAWELNTN